MTTERDDTTILQPSTRESVLVRNLTLRVMQGPDAGVTARVDEPSFLIGTGADADLRLNDPAASRAHLRLRLGAGGVVLFDEGSTNGTWLHGQRIREATIVSDVTITLGGSVISIRLDATPRALALSSSETFGAAIGRSAAMRHVFDILERAAPEDVSVLLEGESGVGKEILARELHRHSRRAEGPFVVFDCSAVAANLVESELFGHERGAFTGAASARRGLFAEADGGTLFLDEIGELELGLQPKLLRALEQREIRAVGSNVSQPFDVRIVAATNRRLQEAVRKNEFRGDLFYRLAVARVVVPPLRERVDDVEPLAAAFLRAWTRDGASTLPADLLTLLRAYAWPGNVRELRNVIQRFAFLGAREPGALFDREAGPPPTAELLSYDEARERALDAFEAAYVADVLQRAGGSAAKAAQLAGVARQSFYRIMQRTRRPGTPIEE